MTGPIGTLAANASGDSFVSTFHTTTVLKVAPHRKHAKGQTVLLQFALGKLLSRTI